MKVMTFNTQHCLNFVERRIDFDIMADTILRCGADIVGLNEMRAVGAGEGYEHYQVKELARRTGMHHFYFAKAINTAKGPYGNGFLSKYPILCVENIPIPDPVARVHQHHYETRCILKAELEGGVTVLVTHMGLNPDEQENAVQTVLQNLSAEKCILMGDFNMRPDDPILAPIFDRMTDAAAGFCADKLSFPSDSPDRKIDYIFVSRDIEVLDADIPAIVASDHRPHTAVLKI